MINENQVKCPKCFKSSFWKTSDNRLKCKSCSYLFSLKSNYLNLPNEILNEIISEFLLGHSINIILERVNISKYKLLKTLTLLRMLMAKDIPDVFRKIIKLDLDNFQLSRKIKNPIVGIFYKEKKVYAKILSNIRPKDLKLFLKSQEEKNSIGFSQNWQKHIGLAYKGRLYRLTFSENKKYYFDSIETFWGFLKRKLAAKGGVRKEKLPLFLGEYVWKYNNKNLSLKEQEKKLLTLVCKSL